MGFPIEITYIIVLLVAITAYFLLLKRPIYEAMFFGYAVMIVVTKQFNQFLPLLLKPSTNTLFYAIVAFLLLAYIFGKTNVLEGIINVILALVGRVKGGAGFVSLFGSTFMAALSGTGPGNVAATGVFTIPTMIRTGFPKHLAATVEMSASSLGPMIPPSGTILLAFATLEVLYPGEYTMSTFWMVVWGVGIWFVLQRIITLLLFAKYYDVKAMPAAEIPHLGDTLKKSWKTLLLPLLIFLPLLFDFIFKDTLITQQLGKAGASAFSSSVILFTPGLAAVYALIISRKEIPGGIGIPNILKTLREGAGGVVPVAATVYFAYSISFLFGQLEVGPAMGSFIQSLGLSKWQLAFFIPIFTAFLGMVLPGSAQIAIFGTGIVGGMAALGTNPLLAAAMLPTITGALEGMTPPLALSMYAAMGISGSGFIETSKSALIWVGAHAMVAVLIFGGLIPILFL
jgi:TRAP-type C4-dicarboxylate transport system permease large subunit